MARRQNPHGEVVAAVAVAEAVAVAAEAVAEAVVAAAAVALAEIVVATAAVAELVSAHARLCDRGLAQPSSARHPATVCRYHDVTPGISPDLSCGHTDADAPGCGSAHARETPPTRRCGDLATGPSFA